MTLPVDMARKRRPRVGTGRLRRSLLYLLLGAGSFLLGILVFNFVVMPTFVRHGKDVEVPDLKGKPLAYAESALRHADLRLGDVSSRFETESVEGTIVAQAPRGGSRIKSGSVVSLVISAGEEATQVPGVVGEYLDHARQLLDRESLRVGRISRVHSAEDPPDRVLGTDPAPSSSVPKNSEVNLLVSLGPKAEEYRMPDLRGYDPELIRAKLEQVGFLVDLRYIGVRDRGEHHTILNQQPAAGERITAGQRIVLEAE